MIGARKRKGVDSARRKRVSFIDINNESDEPSMIQRIANHKLYLLLITCCVITLICMFWPPPKFSKHAQNWHDSGYIFKFQQHNIFYQDIFKQSKSIQFLPALLIIHGFPTSSYDWKNLVPSLHKRFSRIIIPDLLGLGFSDKPTSYAYTIDEQATMIEQLLGYLNITDVHILAHDYGDTIAQEILSRDNDPKYQLSVKIRSVCLTNGGIIPTHYKPRPIQKLFLIPGVRLLAPLITFKFVFNSRFSAIFGPESQPTKEILDDFWAILLHKGGHMAIPEILVYLNERAMYKDRWIGALQETKHPLHLIYGPLDPINKPDGFFKEYKRLVVQSTYTVLENIGHYPQLEDEVAFMKSYNDFLNRVEHNYSML